MNVSLKVGELIRCAVRIRIDGEFDFNGPVRMTGTVLKVFENNTVLFKPQRLGSSHVVRNVSYLGVRPHEITAIWRGGEWIYVSAKTYSWIIEPSLTQFIQLKVNEFWAEQTPDAGIELPE